MIFSILVALAAFIASLAWFIATPGYEPAIAALTSLLALVGLYLTRQGSRRKYGQNQKVSGSGIGIQAAGDVRIGTQTDSRRGSDAK